MLLPPRLIPPLQQEGSGKKAAARQSSGADVTKMRTLALAFRGAAHDKPAVAVRIDSCSSLSATGPGVGSRAHTIDRRGLVASSAGVEKQRVRPWHGPGSTVRRHGWEDARQKARLPRLGRVCREKVVDKCVR